MFSEATIFTALLDRAPRDDERSGLANDPTLVRRILFSDEFFANHQDSLRDMIIHDRALLHKMDTVTIVDETYIDSLTLLEGEAFVSACYQIFLGRYPECNATANALSNMRGRFMYALTIIESEEFAMNDIVVTDGLRRRVSQLAQQEMPEHVGAAVG